MRSRIPVDNDFDAALVCANVFPDDGETEAGAFDGAGIFRAALIKRFEYPAPILGKNAGALVHDVDYDVRPASAQLHANRAPGGGEFDRVRKQVVRDRFHLVLIGFYVEFGGGQVQAEVLGSHRQRMLLGDARHEALQIELRERQRRSVELRAVVTEQILDQLLQAQRVLSQDTRNFELAGRHFSGDFVRKQFHPFTQRRQRRLEFMGNVTQESRFLLFQVEQAQAQPVELPAERFQVGRTIDGDARIETPLAQSLYCRFKLRYRLGNEHGGTNHQQQGDRYQRQQLPENESLNFARHLLHGVDFAVHQRVALFIETARRFRKSRQLGRRKVDDFGFSPRTADTLEQRSLSILQRLHCLLLFGVQRQCRHFVRCLHEAFVREPVALQQRRIADDRKLADAALHAGDLFDQEARVLRCLDCLIHGTLAVSSQLVNRIGIVDQGEDKGQNGQREAGEDQLEKGARVVELHQEELIS